MMRFLLSWISFHGITDLFLPCSQWLPYYSLCPLSIFIPMNILNTFTILIPSVIGILISCCMGAYAFSRLNWPYRDFIFAVLMTTLMLPYAVTVIPTFLIWAKLGLVNTFWPLIIPKWFGAIFYIFLLRQFF